MIFKYLNTYSAIQFTHIHLEIWKTPVSLTLEAVNVLAGILGKQ